MEPLPVLISGLSPKVVYQLWVQAVVEVNGEAFLGEKSESVTVTTAGTYNLANCFPAISHFVCFCMHELFCVSLAHSIRRA